MRPCCHACCKAVFLQSVFKPQAGPVLEHLGQVLQDRSCLLSDVCMCLMCRSARAEGVLSGQAMAEVANIGLKLYRSSFRKQDAARQIAQQFQTHFPGVLFPDAASPPGSLAAAPFVLTPRVKHVWKLLVLAAKSNTPEPILVVAPDGSGKSACIQALAAMLQQHVDGCYLTAETDPAELVGQQMPSDNKDPTAPSIAWVHGTASQAYQAGSWLLLDNLGQAEASVLERLNPLLEEPPDRKGGCAATGGKENCRWQLQLWPCHRLSALCHNDPSAQQQRA